MTMQRKGRGCTRRRAAFNKLCRGPLLSSNRSSTSCSFCICNIVEHLAYLSWVNVLNDSPIHSVYEFDVRRKRLSSAASEALGGALVCIWTEGS